MASAWGINKTMAQIHALLYAEQQPLDTDTIMERLQVSRGNANMNLHNLMQWGLVHKISKNGTRKDFYTAEKDVWSTAARIIKERQQREVSPLKVNLQACMEILEETDSLSSSEKDFRKRLESFMEFLDIFQDFSDALLPYVSQRNMKSLRRFVSLAKARNLMRTKPSEVLPWPPDKD